MGGLKARELGKPFKRRNEVGEPSFKKRKLNGITKASASKPFGAFDKPKLHKTAIGGNEGYTKVKKAAPRPPVEEDEDDDDDDDDEDDDDDDDDDDTDESEELDNSSDDEPSKSNPKAKEDSIGSENALAATGMTESSDIKKTFAELGVIDQLCDACKERGYKFPTPIQMEAIPLTLSGRDVIGLAETGSGKTAAFSLPMLQALMEKPQALFGLVLAPTRELAYQISQEIEALGAFIGVKTAVIVGGMREVDQAIALSKKPHIIVATPGRLFYHLQETKGFSLRSLKYLVMDEADRLLDEDFKNELDKILKVIPREGRRTMLFSATMSSKVAQLQRASLSNPAKVSISSTDHQTVKTLVQSWFLVQHSKKDLYLVYLLTLYTGQTTIIFARTVAEVQRLAYLLRALGFGAIPLHGQLAQSARLGALNKFKSKSRDILVATDVAARGLDIPSVDVVLNYDIPGDSKTYVHRVGRTARAGKSGKAISLVSQYDPELWLRLERALGQQVPVEEVAREELDVFTERVGEAQREAIKKVNDEKSKMGQRRKGKGGKGRTGDDRDREEG